MLDRNQRLKLLLSDPKELKWVMNSNPELAKMYNDAPDDTIVLIKGDAEAQDWLLKMQESAHRAEESHQRAEQSTREWEITHARTIESQKAYDEALIEGYHKIVLTASNTIVNVLRAGWQDERDGILTHKEMLKALRGYFKETNDEGCGTPEELHVQLKALYPKETAYMEQECPDVFGMQQHQHNTQNQHDSIPQYNQHNAQGGQHSQQHNAGTDELQHAESGGCTGCEIF